jgi:hypothetical protein
MSERTWEIISGSRIQIHTSQGDTVDTVKRIPEVRIVCVVSTLYWDSQLLRTLRLESWLMCFC